ncbi:metal-dependent hydrolase [Sulfuriroseicoccus oceanibius]|uniref:Metal-dependent hydrolase n=1 Tax=Sulfuriroseicoccus oceanibius TaxID=2707525 RepID=A0A6B3LE44_9BACT|nr:metal-dependent hydrolase [Sulfuriroseicoccus oceanibius]QQL45893.1 metal-dependent hydrolase [Sulfuriroseicoccus oceanibius]
MDPISQVCFGAAAAGIASRKSSVRRALLIGGLAGALPDLDVLIKSSTDPLLTLQYHRHFTHAILFAPIIGVLVAALSLGLGKLLKREWSFRELFLFATLGALSHGLLDACTSYGTHLLLPFSNARISWDIISIIDPIFTLPLLVLLIIGAARKSPTIVRTSLAICLVYFGLGIVQRERAEARALELAESRGHVAEEVNARPSFANLVLWRTIYRYQGTYYVDAVWQPPFATPRLYEGESVDVVDDATLASLVPADSTHAYDIQRYKHFAQGALCFVDGDRNVLGDLRYAMLPNSIQPLWAIELTPDQPDQHVTQKHFRRTDTDADSPFASLWQMIRGQDIAE